MLSTGSIRQGDEQEQLLETANDSQDTLLLAHYVMKDFGVGLRYSPPPPSPPPPQLAREPASNDLGRVEKPSDQTRGTRRLDGATRQTQHSSIPETQDAAILDPDPPIDIPLPVWDAHDDDGRDGAVAGVSLPDTLPPSAEIDSTSRRRKMDSTQASTQSNAGRSYDQYRRLPSSGHALSSAQPPTSPKPGRTSSPPPDTLVDDDDDDLGVRFDLAPGPATNKAVSPGGPDDLGYVDFGSLANFRNVATQPTVESPTPNLPETPAPPKNPFRNSRSQLLSTSQLFRATQFSSPIKLASPTSSRPSPADFPANSISPNPVISSPLKARGLRSSPAVDITSSPEILPGTISSRLNDRASSPVNSASTGNPVVPESSHDSPARKRSVPEPMSTYEPMRKSQERRSTSDGKSDPLSSGDEDDMHSSFDRRRKAKSKKEAALKQLTAINFPRPPKGGDVEISSTSQRKRQSQADADPDQRHGENLPTNELDDPDDAEGIEDPPTHPVEQGHAAEDDESTQSDVEEEAVPTVNPTPSTVPVLPRSSTKSATQLARDSGIESMSNGDAIPETSPTSRRHEPPSDIMAPSAEPAPLEPEAKSTPNFQSSPPAFSTRARKAKGRKGYPRAPSPTSSLSNLASTPQLPSTNSAAGHGSTAPASSPTESTIVASSSPVVAQARRRDARPQPSRLKTTGSAESLRHSTRRTRRDSTSTDELARSVTATPTFEQSLRVSRASISRSASRSGRGAMKPPPAHREQKLFENMAFAISFQSRKPGETNDQYSVRMEFSTTIQRRIRLAGGRILENGFDELFDALSLGTTPLSTPASSPGSAASDTDITLTAEGRTTGFTALIADGHSRKVKYMQALALGLPCVAARWATTCLDRGALVDWTPYLLCAGQSAFLGDAVRSRTLAPYDPASARLGEVVARRERLLSGSRILAVVRRAREGKKMAYVFLARVLGASLTRVYDVEEARREMKAAEEAGRAFDWVYADGKADEEALFAAPGTAAAAAAGGGKKRKRAAGGAAASFAALPLVKRVRTLSDELVIQSLILGRLIEEGEMEG